MKLVKQVRPDIAAATFDNIYMPIVAGPMENEMGHVTHAGGNNSATATGGRHRGLCSGCRRPLPRGNGSWLDSIISRQTTSRAPQRPMASFTGSHAATARIAGLGPASSALHRPSVSPAASSSGAECGNGPCPGTEHMRGAGWHAAPKHN